jgi:CO dehydrogenase maturation factor
LGLNPHGSSQTRTLAVAGKGGAGKTTLVAIMARILVEKGVHLLLVDADPPISLTYALGADPTKTLGELRLRLMEDPRQRREIGDRHIRDVILDEALVHLENMDLLILGQAEGPGCYCSLNELLKFGIESLAKKYDVALIDCEAGIEQINRRVINSIGTLIMVSDATVKGLRTASYLSDIAGKYGVEGDYSTGLVLNKVNKNVSALEEKAKKMGLSLLGVIPLDENVADFDQEGMPTFDLPSNSPSMDAVRQIASRLRL